MKVQEDHERVEKVLGREGGGDHGIHTTMNAERRTKWERKGVWRKSVGRVDKNTTYL